MPRRIQSSGKVTVGYYVSSAGIVFLHMRDGDQKMFQLAVDTIKQLPADARTYLPDDKIWAISSDVFNKILPFFQVSVTAFKVVPYTERVEFFNFVDPLRYPLAPKPKIADAPDKFFRNFNKVVEKTAALKNDKQELAELTGVKFEALNSLSRPELKKLYRQTALKLHPDRTGDSGQRMSTFTSLWRIYVGSTN